MAHLAEVEWPGDIRQLENVVYRAVVMSEGDQLGLSDLPQAAHRHTAASAEHASYLILGSSAP